ncbi:MAG: HlyD family type I secretion periplasmic adaptor subunit [Minwuia sp.]|uniref:HlyD family type I secretion periplasmic adaptor subunit n=1 Tax=Minwuia sp. TaxID=2493630 RepID=UPI003A892322
MTALDDLSRRHRPRSALWLTRTIALLILLLAGWALIAQLDEVAVAEGQVVPQGDVKVVQHLEGGIVEELMVQEGDRVEAGAPLLRLALGVISSNPEELRVRLDGLLLKKARLEAEADGSDPTFAADVAARRPEVVQAERRAYQARKSEFESAIAVLNAQERQSSEEAREFAAARDARRQQQALAEEALRTLEDLAKDGLVAPLEVNQKRSDLAQLIGEIQSLSAAIGRANASRNEAVERKQETERVYRREAQAELADVEVEIASIRQRLTSADDQQRRTLVRAPIDGVVGEMKVRTIGGVVSPGQPVMEIVPTGGSLVVEARLRPSDRGFVSEGQPATVKISTYDFVRFGGLDGTVVRIAPDATLDETGTPFFKVVVETEKSWLGEREGELPISAGMQASVDIHTGSRSVANFLLRPVLRLRQEAFRER